MNTLKTTLLLMTLSLLLIAVGGWFGGASGMTVALVLAGACNAVTYWFSDKIVLKMYRAREVARTDEPGLLEIVNYLAMKAQLPMPRVYLIDEAQPNAFATGRNPEHGAVAVTSGILQLLTREELQGVIAHELAHIKNRDILIGTVAATVAAAISYVAQIAQWGMLFGGRNNDGEESGNPLAALAMMIIAPIAALLIQLAISRSREYGADAAAARITDNPLYLASALNKLQIAGRQVPLQASPATAHMFIVNPLSGGGITKLFSTHPPIEERIARLQRLTHEQLMQL
jgi:heat shock protein HtpX